MRMLNIDLHRDRPARVQEPGSGDLPGLEYFQSESEYLKPINDKFITMNYRTFVHNVISHINSITLVSSITRMFWTRDAKMNQ